MGSTAKGIGLGVGGGALTALPWGKIWKGLQGNDARQVGQADTMTKQQQDFMNMLLGGQGGNTQNAFSHLLEGGGEEQFQKGVVDPTLKTYNQQILPSIGQRFGDANAGSSSALNQALVSSSEDLANVLGGQRINYEQVRGNQQLGALQQIMNLLGQRSFEPIVQGPQEGLLKSLIPAAGQIGAAAISSETVKENIVDYKKGLDLVRKLHVKNYDYTIPVPGRMIDRVGLIAEEVPKELQADVGGILGVDIYGLVGVLVNCVQQLDAKVKALEAQNGDSI